VRNGSLLAGRACLRGVQAAPKGAALDQRQKKKFKQLREKLSQRDSEYEQCKRVDAMD